MPENNFDLFESEKTPSDPKYQPLAERMRPQSLADFAGQTHLVGAGMVLRQAIETDRLLSMIFWGPPAVGKTTLARIIARETKSDFHAISAVTAGVGDIRKIIEIGKKNRKFGQKHTILFIDEIHRFNKAQQDALLHSVEDGTLILIGATTENPSFEVISALLSRCQVYQLNSLESGQIKQILQRAIATDSVLLAQKVILPDPAMDDLVKMTGGDVRSALNALELSAQMCPRTVTGEKIISVELIQKTLQKTYARYDKQGDMHYDTISAFIKSVRGSDPDAAVHYLARMLDAGEDPKFIARRLIVLASEDIGNAQPLGLVLATSAFTAVTYIGMPEARIILAQVTTYLASAEKSNAAYLAISEALADVQNQPLEAIPLHLRNAPTDLMQQFGYANGYKYPHDFPENFVAENYLPSKLREKCYYRPTGNGLELKLRERLRKLWPKKSR